MFHRLSRATRGQPLVGCLLSRRSPTAVTRGNLSSYAGSDESPPMTNDPVVNKILETWPGDLRNRLNYVCSIVKDNQVYKNEARIRFIDTQEWESYNFKFRRHLMVFTLTYSNSFTGSFLILSRM